MDDRQINMQIEDRWHSPQTLWQIEHWSRFLNCPWKRSTMILSLEFRHLLHSSSMAVRGSRNSNEYSCTGVSVGSIGLVKIWFRSSCILSRRNVRNSWESCWLWPSYCRSFVRTTVWIKIVNGNRLGQRELSTHQTLNELLSDIGFPLRPHIFQKRFKSPCNYTLRPQRINHVNTMLPLVIWAP